MQLGATGFGLTGGCGVCAECKFEDWVRGFRGDEVWKCVEGCGRVWKGVGMD